MAAVQSGAARHRCLQRADNPGGIAPWMFLQFRDQGFQKPHTVLWLGAVTAHCSEPPTGREALLLALLQQPLADAGPTQLEYRGENGVVRVTGLNVNFARPIPATCTSSDLGQELGQPFLTAEIRAEQQAVRIDNPDAGYPREMVAFGQHLGTKNYAGAGIGHFFAEGRHRMAPGHGVTVNPVNGNSRVALLHDLLGLFRAEP